MEICVENKSVRKLLPVLFALFCHGLCGCGWYIYELREK